MQLAPGTRLGPYEIVAPLGRGGMGEVYKGIDTRLGRNVAIKLVAESLSSDPRNRKRLEREAKTISRLQHANICTLHDIGSDGDSQYLVMEYLEGQTLENRLRAGPLAPEQILRIGSEIASAIEAAHRSGIVHRDLKPGNVMLGPAGTKVLDFGLAKAVQAGPPDSATPTLSKLDEPITREGTIAGTLLYMAPEQLEGKEPDRRSDIWALGCILYEMATGARPFRGDSHAALISSIMGSEPKSLTTLRTPVDSRLVRIVETCLEKDPAARCQSAEDLVAELRSALENPEAFPVVDRTMPTTATATGFGSVPTGGRRFLRATVVVGVLLAGAALAGYLILRPDPPSRIAGEGAAVAVLPFENLTGNDQLGYIGLGLAAGLTSQLSELPGINVVGRSRAWDTNENAAGTNELAELLGVNFVVEGEVQASGRGLQVNIAILDGMSSMVLWSERFAETKDELYALQQQIARSVARVLSVPVSAEDRRRLTRAGPSSQAFHYYLQGIERLEQRANPRRLEFAADLFRQAIRLEGDIAVFHAALSNALSLQDLEGTAQSRSDATEAEAEARKAVALDPRLAEAHVALARALRFQGRHAEAIAELRPVLAEHPKPDEVFLELALGYELTGDTEASVRALESAVALGPENWFNWNALGVTQAEQGDVEAAKNSLEKALALAPESVTWPRLNLGGVKMLLGDHAGAIEDFEATGSTTSNPNLASNMATAYFFLGRLDRAESMYRLAVSLDSENYVLRRNLGDALLAQKREQEAVEEFMAALRLVEAGLIDQPRSSDLLRSRALYAAKTRNCGAAVEHANEARPFLLSNWKGQLDLAMTFALCGQTPEALDAVKACLDLGLPGEIIGAQPEFLALADNADFLALTAGSD